jgi:exopolyphosphatase/guanosine-5'-triphosphate,3'-diphosphate pyrophosphatase
MWFLQKTLSATIAAKRRLSTIEGQMHGQVEFDTVPDMRLAAIDCGTNTAMLLVVDVDPSDGKLVPVADHLEMPRLGQDLDRTHRLHPDAIRRTLEAIDRQIARAASLSVDELVLVGTESLRAAQNSDELLSALAERGVTMRIVSGDDEARLAFLSVARSLPLPPGVVRSVLDIGGGSTELIVGQEHPEVWASVKIGSVRLHERFLSHDPPTEKERHRLVEAIDAALAHLPKPEGELVALAGTATTIGAIHLGLTQYDGKLVDGLRMPTSRVREIVSALGVRSVAERTHMAGLDARRADVIYAGAMILLRVAERAGVTDVVLSDRGVRFGMLEELSARKNGPSAHGQR